MKVFAAYAAAGALGIGAPVLVLHLARSSAVGADPLMAAAGVVIALGIVAAALAAVVPRHWLALALMLSVPLALLGIVMFAALADIGEFFWIWLAVGLGGVAAALGAAYLAARTR